MSEPGTAAGPRSRSSAAILPCRASTTTSIVVRERNRSTVCWSCRPNAPLFYANAQAVRDAIDAAAASTHPTPTVVVLDLDANDNLDITSSDHLSKLERELTARGTQLCLVHLHTPAARIATETGVLDRIGPEHVFPNIDAAITWARTQTTTDTSHG